MSEPDEQRKHDFTLNTDKDGTKEKWQDVVPTLTNFMPGSK